MEAASILPSAPGQGKAAPAPDLVDTLRLYPGGYPVHVDVPQARVGGAGTALRFTLPPRGLNFPLTHTREAKLVVALAGQLELHAGRERSLRLAPGQALLVPPGLAHRIAQHGALPATVGVALWPGAVEEAFRALDRLVAGRGFERAQAAALFAAWGVRWDGADGAGAGAPHLHPAAFGDVATALPAPLRAALDAAWRPWLARTGA